MYKKYFSFSLLTLVLFLLSFQNTKAQDHRESHEIEDLDHEHHHSHEVGISSGPVYFFNEKELRPGLHLHYTYNFPHTNFGLGLAYEHIFDDHQHNFFGLELAYRPFHPLTFNFTPGTSIEGANWDEKEFAFHFETVYEFEFDRFHIGPTVELAYHPEDYHISIGLHIGLGL